LALLGAVVFSASALAFPKTWTLVGVTFTDGGIAGGSFTYDADTNVYSNINIVTTAGTVLTGATYNFFSNGFPPSPLGVLVNASNASDLTGTRAFAPHFIGLTNVLTSTSVTGLEGTCADATCSAPSGPARFVIAGGALALQTNPIPTLSAPMLALLGVALLGAGLFLLRR